jgi:tetratricopeptide (TPR) repeat protein
VAETETPGALLRRANQLLLAGNVSEAIPVHERLLALRPDLSDSWYNLAYLQRCARDFETALQSYRRALDLGVQRPEDVYVNRAAILSEHLDRAEAAEEELKHALRINPRFVTAWLNLGNLYEDWGRADDARTAYEQVLHLDPTNGRALARLATIATFEGVADRLLPRLEQALADPHMSNEDAAEIGFALGYVLDSMGAYDRAFRAYATANLASRASAPPGLRYDRSAQEALVDRLTRIFSNRVDLAGPSEAPPLFICGMFRSGSTLAEQILARHSRVTAGGELEFLPALVHERLQPYPESLASASPQMLDDIRRSYLEELRLVHPTADIVTDKRPDNFLHIGLIKTLFPDAKIVHTRRNPLDNILSIYFLHFEHSITYGLDIDDIAHWYTQYLTLMDHWKSLYPNDIHEFDYDRAVRDPRPNIDRLLQFCGLEWQEACLSAHVAENAVRTASAWQVRQPLHCRSSGRWRHYEAHLREVMARLGGADD